MRMLPRLSATPRLSTRLTSRQTRAAVTPILLAVPLPLRLRLRLRVGIWLLLVVVVVVAAVERGHRPMLATRLLLLTVVPGGCATLA